jgi:hypothetical protein
VATSWRATVQPLGVAGVRVRVDPSDLALRVGAAPGHRVVVPGRPAHVVPGGRSATWHDPRIRARPGAFAVPFLVDGRRATLRGEIRKVPAPAWWPWLLLASPFLVALAVALRRDDDTWPMRFAIVAGVATALAALGFALDRYASAGIYVESANEILIAVACLVVAIRVPRARFAIAGAVGTLALFLAATKATVLGRGIVFSGFGATPTRALVVIALTSGLAAVILATWHFLQAADAPP